MGNQTLESPAAQKLAYDGTVTCSLGVADLDKAIKWYSDVLGFELLYKVDEIAWAELRTAVNGATIGLGQREGAGQGGNATPVFGVNDLDAARSELEGKGVKFDGDTMEFPGMVKLATFFDPDGNTFMLSQTLAQH
jgi:predicted enzyme related to lactoylglutathione lyase